jgi:hypothetical protein
MMATKIDQFTEQTLADLAQVKRHLEQVAYLSQEINNRWIAMGKLNMPGWGDAAFETRPFTAIEFARALNALDDDLAGSSLMTLNSVGPIDPLVKMLIE